MLHALRTINFKRSRLTSCPIPLRPLNVGETYNKWGNYGLSCDFDQYDYPDFYLVVDCERGLELACRL